MCVCVLQITEASERETVDVDQQISKIMLETEQKYGR